MKSANADISKPPRLVHNILSDQLKLLVRLRWLACAGILAAGYVSTATFPVLKTADPIYVCAAVLLCLNCIYLLLLSGTARDSRLRGVVFGLVQIELDLVILSGLLHFSGGITNPFVLFYVFHIILATIILPSTYSFFVGLSAIVMFSIVSIGELNGWPWFEHVDLLLATDDAFWNNPVYVLGEFVAFSATTMLAQYLTRTVITRMTAKELEAARNHDVLQAMVKAMGEGLIFITAGGKVTICNPAAKRWARGISADHKFPSIDDLPSVLADHIRQLPDSPGGGDIQSISFYLDDDKKRYIEAKSCPVTDVDGRLLGYVIVGQDLTDHKKLEQDLIDRTEETAAINEMLKRSRVEMAQREKMVAVGQMATGIAHEIGNPLASLSSVVQYLGRKLTGHNEKEHLLMIGNQVDRISTILRRMQSLSRPATSEYKWTDVNATIENTLALIKFDNRARSVTIISEPDSELPMVWLNPLHLEQVLLNITINALDAMAAQPTEDGQILKVTRRFKDDMIEIAVSDTGIGMEPQVCKRAFESFFTTKEIGKGTGLGLFISYNLINEVDGTINLDSTPGQGTTVTIRLPIRPKKHLIEGSDTNMEQPATTAEDQRITPTE
jgi:signal transduction histidine kinase